MAMTSVEAAAHLKSAASLPCMNGLADGGGGKGKARPASLRAAAQPAGCLQTHVNNLWSVWYGVCIAGIQTYITVRAAHRFMAYAALPAGVTTSPFLELTAYAALTSVGALLIPLFIASAILRVGNLANDGCKLGRHLGACSAEPTASATANSAPAPATAGAAIRALWLHGGPTAAFLHVTSALCLLLPRLIMEARLIHAGFLPRELLWRTDLEWLMLPHDRRLVHNLMSQLNTSITLIETQQVQPQIALQGDDRWGSMSPEVINYAVALIVYSIRYPAVFWYTNKAFGALFSLQLLANTFQCLMLYTGVCVLYKVHVYGAVKVLPLLQHRSGGELTQPFLLNAILTLCLFILCTVLVLTSSLVFYLYGYGRFNAFLEADKSRRRFTMGAQSGACAGASGSASAGSGSSSASWNAFTHCAALCVFLCCAVAVAPLMHDLIVVYRGSLDGASLTAIIACISHLLLWILLWLIFTIKQTWIFKLRVAVGRATMRSARSVKLVTEVELAGETEAETNDASPTVPLLVLSHGRTYAIADTEPKKAILGVVQQFTKGRKGADGENGEDGQEQIYWLRPKPPSLKNSPDSATDKITWLGGKQSGSGTPNGLPTPSAGPAIKHKVTFVDANRKGSNRSKGKGRQGRDAELDDDGDYATLKEVPIENKLLETVRTGNVTYVNATDYEDPSPLLTPDLPQENGVLDPEADVLGLALPPPSPPSPPALPLPTPLPLHPPLSLPPAPAPALLQDVQQAVSSRVLLRRADSGMPPRSESASTESSGCEGSPARDAETSSGVHSNSSGDTHQQRRATSVTDLCVHNHAHAHAHPHPHAHSQWKSCSLQRNILPPTSAGVMQPIYAFGGAHKPMAPQLVPQVTAQVTTPVPTPLPTSTPSSSNIPAQPPTATSAPTDIQMGGCLAVLLEGSDSTVVIRRRQPRPKTAQLSPRQTITEEPFGRSTNMRMTSFTDHPEYGRACVSTLPHYPTQPPVADEAILSSPRCATLPTHGPYGPVGEPVPTTVTSGASCQSFPRPHTTIPTHHNGVRLFSGNGVGACAPQNGHVLVQGMSPTIKYSLQQHLRTADRDFLTSRNSDVYMQYRS